MSVRDNRKIVTEIILRKCNKEMCREKRERERETRRIGNGIQSERNTLEARTMEDMSWVFNSRLIENVQKEKSGNAKNREWRNCVKGSETV